MKFPTLTLSVPLFLTMLTDRDLFSVVLLTVMVKDLALKAVESVVGVVRTLMAFVRSSSRRTL